VPGAALAVRYVRFGVEQQRTIRVVADPQLEIVRIEATGGKLTAGQRAFRGKWLDE
jgi:hypothetical protein